MAAQVEAFNVFVIQTLQQLKKSRRGCIEPISFIRQEWCPLKDFKGRNLKGRFWIVV